MGDAFLGTARVAMEQVEVEASSTETLNFVPQARQM